MWLCGVRGKAALLSLLSWVKAKWKGLTDMTNGAALPPGWATHASQAQPVVPVDPTTGDAVTWASVGGGGGGTDVALHDATTTTQHLAIDASGNASVKLGAALPAGTAVIGHVIIDSAGAVSVTSLPALAAGTNVIGHVVVDSAASVSVTALPAIPTGTNTIGSARIIDATTANKLAVNSDGSINVNPSSASSSSAINDGTTTTRKLTVNSDGSINVNPSSSSSSTSLNDATTTTQHLAIDASGNASVKVTTALPAGTAVIGHVIVDSAGSVSVTALPALPAGSNAIGTVGVTSLPALPTGSNVIGHVIIDSAGSVSVTALPALPTGSNSIGTVGLNAGSNLIGTAQLMDSAGVNVAGVDASHNQLVKVNAALPAGSALIGGTNLVDSAGTNKATVDAAGNLWVRGGFVEQASLTAGSLNADLVASTDVSAYKFVSLQVTGTWVGTLTFQGCNDNSNFSSILLTTLNPNSVNFAQTTTGNNIFIGFVPTRYFRVRMTSYTSGTANATLECYTVPPSFFSTYIAGSVLSAQSGTWTVQMPTSTTGTLTSVTAATSNTQLLASNTARKGMYVFNESTAIMYLAFNATASTTSYTVQVPANSFFEMPTAPVYTGQINAVWSAVNGSARLTEAS